MHSSPPPSFVNHKSRAVSKRQRLPSPVVKEREGKKKKKSMTADTNSSPRSKFEGSRGEWMTGGHGNERKTRRTAAIKPARRSADWKALRECYGKKKKMSHNKKPPPAVFDTVITEKNSRRREGRVQRAAKPGRKRLAVAAGAAIKAGAANPKGCTEGQIRQTCRAALLAKACN